MTLQAGGSADQAMPATGAGDYRVHEVDFNRACRLATEIDFRIKAKQGEGSDPGRKFPFEVFYRVPLVD